MSTRPGPSSGLEQLRAALSAERAGLAELLDFAVIDLTHGHVVFALKPDQTTLGALGTVPGLVAALLLDSAASCAVHSALPAGATCATVQLNVHQVRPLRAGTPVLRGTGDIVHLASDLATATATVTDHIGQLVAHGTVTCTIRAIATATGPPPPT